MFLIYWLLKFPHKINISTIFLLGIVIAIFEDNLVGIRTISLMIVTYLVFNFQMIFYLNKLKQSFTIIIISIIKYFIFYFLEFFIIHNTFKLDFLYTSIMNGICWPLIVFIMKKIN